MLDQNISFEQSRKKSKLLHGNYARIDPHAEIESTFDSLAIAQVDHYDHGTPIPSIENVVQAKKWVDENHK